MDTQLKKGILDLCILSIIGNKEVYAYGLKQEIEKVMDINENTLYPLLRRLEKDGLLSTYVTVNNNRARKYYSITEEGKVYLKEKKKEWYQFVSVVDQVLGGQE